MAQRQLIVVSLMYSQQTQSDILLTFDWPKCGLDFLKPESRAKRRYKGLVIHLNYIIFKGYYCMALLRSHSKNKLTTPPLSAKFVALS